MNKNNMPIKENTKRKSILFVGASGYGNLGDDGYKTVFNDYLKDEFDLYFNSPYPDLEMVKHCDHLVLGGGGIIYVNKTAHFQYMRMYIDEAIKQGKTYSFISCGVQPTQMFKDDLIRTINFTVKEIAPWKKYLEGAEVVTIRGSLDKRILKKLAPKANVVHVPDACYLLKPVEYHLTKPNGGVVILTNVSTKFNHTNFSKYNNEFIKKYGENRYCIAFARTDEVPTEKYVPTITPQGNLGQRVNLTPSEGLRILMDAESVITSRYHGKIFARVAGMPEDKIHSIDTRFKSVFDEKPNDIKDAEENINLLIKAIYGKYNTKNS